MRRTTILGFHLLVLICLSIYCQAQQWSGILNPVGPNQKNVSRSAIDWSNAGVPGGIPSGNWTQCGATIQASTFGNGSTDATASINAAIAACGSSQYVLLSPGTFLVNSAGAGSPQVRLNKNNVVLRGSGADQTILNSTGTNSGGIVSIGARSDPNPSQAVNITSGATAGSTSIVVSNASNFAVGKLVLINELNDPNYVTINGASDVCDYCDGPLWNGQRVRGQMAMVTSVNGTTIGITPALFTAYTLTPFAVPLSSTVRYAGIESLQIFSNNTHTSQTNSTVEFYACAYCWAKGIEENYSDGDYTKSYFSLNIEIRDSYFSNNFNHGPGSNNGAIWIGYSTTASKVENNILERCENPVMLQFGAAGNVIAYNYAVGCYGQSGSGFASITIPIEPHGAHVQFNLFEGNVVPELWLDVGHGSSSQSTTFRNWWAGTGYACNSAINTRATVTCPGGSGGGWTTDAARAISVGALDTYDNFVGDIVGSAQQMALPGSKVAVLRWPSSRQYNGTSYGLNFGYGTLSDSGTQSVGSTKAWDTAFIHGLYNFIDASTTWGTGVTQTLPASFYLPGRPFWWGNSIPFPAIGPDVTGGTGPAGHVNMIPAQVCYYNVMGGAEGGAGSPFRFNANSCYPGQPSGTTPAPTGLNVIVR
jgi:hypothetical protein